MKNLGSLGAQNLIDAYFFENFSKFSGDQEIEEVTEISIMNEGLICRGTLRVFRAEN